MTEIPYAFSRAKNSKLTVGTKATAAASPEFISHQQQGRAVLVVYNSGSADVYWGGDDVTTSTGIPIKAGDTAVFPLCGYADEKAVYLVAAASATVTISELTV
ncbi:hypothetical protein [Acidaminococcus massiliensis]|mgnify:CR=1 FL=1|jgi:hypothetical protein|uniref:hypothetical protein n=1 Tax=Acidaminococcus massiliensis TaxID=1852375 RepID=UPI0022E14A3F|nr:hypothetical protein [Acidaminococcus massiliensis]